MTSFLTCVFNVNQCVIDVSEAAGRTKVQYGWAIRCDGGTMVQKSRTVGCPSGNMWDVREVG